jgi:hypothetical protein
VSARAKGKGEGNRVITPTVAVSIVFFSTVTFTFAQALDADVIDLLNQPDDAPGERRRCTVEVENANIPCSDAWYVRFKDGSRAIQFNQVTDDSPVVSIFGTEIAPNKLSVGNVFLRLGNRSIPESEMEAVGECILSEQDIHCDVKTSDDRHIAGHIFPP